MNCWFVALGAPNSTPEGDRPNSFRWSIESPRRLIWSASTVRQRKGYFLAGVGLSTGQQLDAIAVHLNNLLIEANVPYWGR